MNDFVANRVCFYSSMFNGVSNMHQIIEYAHKKGVFGVELMNFCDELRTPDMAMAKELGSLAKKYELKLPCFSLEAYIVGEKKKSFMKKLAAYAEICSELEIPYMHHTIFPPLSPLDCPDELISEIFEEGLESALEINAYARKLGVRTIIENQGLVFNGSERYNRLLSEAKGELLPLFDVGNILFADEMPQTLLESIKAPIAHVHLKDYKFITDPAAMADYVTKGGKRFSDFEICSGDIDMSLVAKLLKNQNYKGLYALEFCKVKDLSEVDRVLSKVTEIFGD